MSIEKPIIWAALPTLLGVIACSGNVCDKAAELCGTPTDPAAGSCVGAARDYANCIVDEGNCSPATLTKCAGGTGPGPLPTTDGGQLPSVRDLGTGVPPSSIELRAHAYVREPDSETVWVPITILNHDEQEPLATDASLFSVETDRATVVAPTADASLTKRPCNGEIAVAIGGKLSCQLIVDLPAALRPVRVRYRDPQGRTAQAELPADACSWQPEVTVEACRDGCDNDGNGFWDCGDFGCCSTRDDCPENTACGTKQADYCPTKGGENTLAACSDGCDNDHNGYTDCNERSCCEARTNCPVGTYCGGS